MSARETIDNIIGALHICDEGEYIQFTEGEKILLIALLEEALKALDAREERDG